MLLERAFGLSDLTGASLQLMLVWSKDLEAGLATHRHSPGLPDLVRRVLVAFDSRGDAVERATARLRLGRA